MTKLRVKLMYYNQHWNVYIYTPEYQQFKHPIWADDYHLRTVTHLETQGDRSELVEYRLRKYTYPVIPIHSFGAWYHNEQCRPGHRGEWSSNSEHINKVFNTNVYEVAVDQCAVAVPLPWLKTLLGDRVTWAPDNIYGEWITHVEGMENTWDNVTEYEVLTNR